VRATRYADTMLNLAINIDVDDLERDGTPW
jgi:hypothetical protein